MSKVPPSCPRCGRSVREPGLWSNAWQCDHHGEVMPYVPAGQISPEAVAMVAKRAAVPLWMPHPMMPGWVVTGIGSCGDDRSGASATVICCSGPGPFGGPADLVLVSEDMAVGLGARFAGIPGTDPGELTHRAPAGKLHADGHPTPLWQVDAGTGIRRHGGLRRRGMGFLALGDPVAVERRADAARGPRAGRRTASRPGRVRDAGLRRCVAADGAADAGRPGRGPVAGLPKADRP